MLTAIDIKKFDENGFIEIKKLIDLKDLNKIKKKYKKIFDGKYSTDVVPDKIKWVKGRDANDIPRSLCNVWKSEIDIAKIVLSAKIGEAAAKLSRWKSTKLNQDSLIWVPPKAGTVTFHQDNPYQDWHVPGGVITAWIPIEDTSINGATLEYLIGSHKNKVSSRLKKFYSKKNYQYIDKKLLKDPDLYKRHYLEVKAGSVVFHHGNMWHGSGYNKTNKNRLSISIHLMDGKSTFHDKIKSPYFNHYKLLNSNKMDETFFPTIWMSNRDTKINLKKYF